MIGDAGYKWHTQTGAGETIWYWGEAAGRSSQPKPISSLGCEKAGAGYGAMGNKLASTIQRMVNQRVTQHFLCAGKTRLRKMYSLLDYIGVYHQGGEWRQDHQGLSHQAEYMSTGEVLLGLRAGVWWF